MIEFVRRHGRKIRDIGIGLAAWESFNFGYDFLFYPFALAYWGIAVGGVVAFIGATIVNTIVFVAYEYMAIDWLGAHALRQIDEQETKTALERLITWLGRPKKNWWEKLIHPFVFVALTLPIDPVIVAIHHRRSHFRGISLRDWGVFIAANTSANLWWLVKVGVVVEGAQWLWMHTLALFAMA